jgi:predicted nucleic-acid-binding Zn-ribbon protein
MKTIGAGILFMVLAANMASAESIFDILNKTFIDNITDLPNSQGIPEKHIQRSGYISGWVDIVGFRQMMREDGIDYVPGNPADYAIVQYDAWNNVDCFGCGVDSFKKNLRVSTVGNQTVASLDIQLIWYEVVSCGKDCTTEIYHLETATFQDFEKSPQIYNIKIENLTAYITEYNNSIYPKTSISLDIPPYISKAKFEYGENTTIYYARFAAIEQTQKGILFANISKSSLWKITGSGMGRIGEHVIIKSANINYQELNITMYTLYEKRAIINYNISRVDYSPEKTWHPFLFYFIGIFTIFSVGAYKLFRRISII